VASFAAMAKDLENLGCDSICIKDMAGLISPAAAAELVSAIKKKTTIPLDLHSHCSSGMAPLSYYAAAQAGVDILDTAFSAFGWGTSQPPTESIAAAFKDTPYDTGLDLEVLYEIGEYFASVSTKYRLLFTAETTRPNINVLLHQIPGGMLSNLVSQLREQNALNRLGEVLEEIPRVRADMGYPPLVTPTSQLVGIQAVLNVLSGERYKQVTQEVRNYFLGQYGRPPAPVNEDIKRLVIGEEKAINVRPAEVLSPELDKLRNDGNKLGILHKEEDLVTYALYPQVAVKFLRGEIQEEALPSLTTQTAKTSIPEFPMEFSVEVDGEVFNVKVASVLGKTVEIEKKAANNKGQPPPGAVVSPLQGMILAIKTKVGATVNKGDVVITIEAMKMQNEVRAHCDGIVKEILVHENEIVNSGDVLMTLETTTLK